MELYLPRLQFFSSTVENFDVTLLSAARSVEPDSTAAISVESDSPAASASGSDSDDSSGSICVLETIFLRDTGGSSLSFGIESSNFAPLLKVVHLQSRYGPGMTASQLAELCAGATLLESFYFSGSLAYVSDCPTLELASNHLEDVSLVEGGDGGYEKLSIWAPNLRNLNLGTTPTLDDIQFRTSHELFSDLPADYTAPCCVIELDERLHEKEALRDSIDQFMKAITTKR